MSHASRWERFSYVTSTPVARDTSARARTDAWQAICFPTTSTSKSINMTSLNGRGTNDHNQHVFLPPDHQRAHQHPSRDCFVFQVSIIRPHCKLCMSEYSPLWKLSCIDPSKRGRNRSHHPSQQPHSVQHEDFVEHVSLGSFTNIGSIVRLFGLQAGSATLVTIHIGSFCSIGTCFQCRSRWGFAHQDRQQQNHGQQTCPVGHQPAQRNTRFLSGRYAPSELAF